VVAGLSGDPSLPLAPSACGIVRIARRGDVWICVRVCVCSALLPVDGRPAAFDDDDDDDDDDESHQDASTRGCPEGRVLAVSRAHGGNERMDVGGGLHRPLFSAIAYEKLAGYNQGTNPCCLAAGV
jgi:hypothetical protein